MRMIRHGATDQSVVVRIIDSTDGTPEQAVTSGTEVSLQFWYRREGGSLVTFSESDLTNLNDAHSDGGLKHIDDGYYRLDIADAAFASGATHVIIGGNCTGMIIIGAEVSLVAWNPQDTVRGGLTALPNAAADAAGGLPISDAGGLDLDAILADTNEVQISLAAGGLIESMVDDLQSEVDGIQADTEDIQSRLPAALTADGNIKADTLRVNGTAQTAGDIIGDTNDIQSRLPAALVSGRMDASVGAMANDTLTSAALAASAVSEIQSGLSTLTQAQVQTECEEALQTYHLDHLIQSADPGSIVANSSLWAALTSKSATPAYSSYNNTTDSHEALRDNVGTAGAALSLAKTTNITGFNDLSAAQVNAEADTALADVGVTTTVTGRIDAATSTRATPAQVNTEVLDVLNVDTFAEPGQEAPAATNTLAKKIGYLFKFLRNKVTQTSTTLNVFADDASTVDQKATVSDDGTTYTRGEIGAGP